MEDNFIAEETKKKNCFFFASKIKKHKKNFNSKTDYKKIFPVNIFFTIMISSAVYENLHRCFCIDYRFMHKYCQSLCKLPTTFESSQAGRQAGWQACRPTSSQKGLNIRHLNVKLNSINKNELRHNSWWWILYYFMTRFLFSLLFIAFLFGGFHVHIMHFEAKCWMSQWLFSKDVYVK